MSKTRVLLLYGGRSVEHGVSVNSARNIFEFIDKSEFEPVPVGITAAGAWFHTATVTRDIGSGRPLLLRLNPSDPCLLDAEGGQIYADIVFPVLHGTDGEDGSIQGLIRALGLPQVGTGVLGSAVGMNKVVAKQLWREAGLPVGRFISFRYEERETIRFAELRQKLGLPFMVKSANLGSSVGVTKVADESQLPHAVEAAFRYDNEILIEEFTKGRELECALLGNEPVEASRPGEIVVSSNYEFYTFDAKYVDPEAVRIDVPAKLTPEIQSWIQELAVKAFRTLHCEDFARLDLFLTDEGRIYLNEINTIPGFTNSSMYPMMWQERGLSFQQLLSRLIHLALERHMKSKRIVTDYSSDLKY